MYLLWKQQKIVAEAWSGKISLPCVPKASNGGFILERNQTPFPKRVCRRCRRGLADGRDSRLWYGERGDCNILWRFLVTIDGRFRMKSRQAYGGGMVLFVGHCRIHELMLP